MKKTKVYCDICKKELNADIDKYFGFNHLKNNNLEYVMRTDTDIDICERCVSFIIALYENGDIKL